MKQLIYCSILLLLFNSCKKESTDFSPNTHNNTDALNKAVFLKLGNYWEYTCYHYHLDSIISTSTQRFHIYDTLAHPNGNEYFVMSDLFISNVNNNEYYSESLLRDSAGFIINERGEQRDFLNEGFYYGEKGGCDNKSFNYSETKNFKIISGKFSFYTTKNSVKDYCYQKLTSEFNQYKTNGIGLVLTEQFYFFSGDTSKPNTIYKTELTAFKVN